MLILASKSPRRSDLLKQAEYPFRVVVSDAEELKDSTLGPTELVKQNALLKAQAVADMVGSVPAVLGADTVVSLDGEIFGKPQDEADAVRMLQALSGREHTVSTGIALIYKEKVFSAAAETKVFFEKLSPEDIRRYVATGEPMGKAGAYAVQGQAAVFISRVEGSFSNVVGLPLCLVTETARRAGVDLYGKNDGA